MENLFGKSKRISKLRLLLIRVIQEMMPGVFFLQPTP
jgi:hypothetical protein